MADNDLVKVDIDGKVYTIREKLRAALQGECELDDEFRKTFTEEEKEVILLLLTPSHIRKKMK